MKKRYLILLAVFLLTGCRQDKSPELIIEEVLTIKYTNDYEDFNDSLDYDKVDKKRRKEVKNYFTDEGLEKIERFRTMTDLSSVVKQYKCNTQIASMDIDVRDSNDGLTNVCFYDIELQVIFEDEDIKPIAIDVSGSLSLYYEDNEWKIGVMLSSRRGIYMSIDNQYQ